MRVGQSLDEAHHLSPLTAEKWSCTAKCLLDGDETCDIHVNRHRRRVLSLTGTVTSAVTRRAAELQLERMYPDGDGPDAAERERRIPATAKLQGAAGRGDFQPTLEGTQRQGHAARCSCSACMWKPTRCLAPRTAASRRSATSMPATRKPPSRRRNVECPFKGMRERHLTRQARASAHCGSSPTLGPHGHCVCGARADRRGAAGLPDARAQSSHQRRVADHARPPELGPEPPAAGEHPKSMAAVHHGRRPAQRSAVTNSSASTQPCAGFVCTEVAGSSMDFTAPELRFVILVENSSSQSDHTRIGRSVRPLRDATGAALRPPSKDRVRVRSRRRRSQRGRRGTAPAGLFARRRLRVHAAHARAGARAPTAPTARR